MHEHDSALAGKESGYTTNARKEEIFSDMSEAPFTVAIKTAEECCLATTPTVLCTIFWLVQGSRRCHQASSIVSERHTVTAVSPRPWWTTQSTRG